MPGVELGRGPLLEDDQRCWDRYPRENRITRSTSYCASQAIRSTEGLLEIVGPIQITASISLSM